MRIYKKGLMMKKMKRLSFVLFATLLTFTACKAQHKNKETKNKTVKPAKTNKQVDEFQTYEIDESIKVQTASKKAQEAWKDNKFGMFIHWGPISQKGRALSHSRHSESHRTGGKPYKPYKKGFLEPEEYDVQYKTFNPTKYNPDEIVQLAKDAGMKYIVFTAKHHAGFSMFDSKVSDYDMMATPYKKDVLKMLEKSCRKKGIEFGFYYSPRDWRHPDCDSDNHHDRYIKYYEAQMDELLTNYGSIYEIWFDGLGPGKWGNTSEVIMKKIRKSHPNAMVNDRGGVGADFYTPEHTISQLNNQENWEACHTTTSQWGYNPKVKAKPFKQLMEILLYTWGGGGNMLLNIGPMGDGSLNPLEVKRLKQVAQWWKTHGEISIRGTRGGPYYQENWGVATKKDNKVFVHVFRWPANGIMTFPNLPGLKVKAARLLNGKEVKLTTGKQNYTLEVTPDNREKVATTIELIFDKSVMDVKPLHVITPLTYKATLTASQNQDEVKNVVDGNAETTWLAADKKKKIWIEASFETPVTIASVVAGRGDDWNPKNKPELQIPDGNGGWKTILKWKPKWTTVKFLKEPVTTQKIRLLVKGTKKYNLAEFELYAPL